MNKIRYILLFLPLLIFSCSPKISDDPTLRLTFSKDTLCFDTVFTTMASSTRKVLIYNANKEDMLIRSITLRDGKYFKINVDGEADVTRMKNIHLAAGDSLFVFVKVNLEKNFSDAPVFVDDEMLIETNSLQKINLEAVGQDVIVLRKYQILADQTLGGSKPYLVYDYIVTDTATTVSIAPGTTFYMHDDAQFIVYGNLIAQGTLEKPIVFRGDRLDELFDSIPYNYVSGKWGSVLLMADAAHNSTWTFDNVDLHSGQVALYCEGESKDNRPNLVLTNSRLHNFSQYGLCCINTDAQVTNCEISNCASYCVYLQGGDFSFVHNTIASFYGSTVYRIQNNEKDTVSAVFINNLSKSYAKTNVYFANNIITGSRRNNLMLATPFPQLYSGLFTHNLLRVDTCDLISFRDNVYQQDSDTVFINDFFTEDYHYYDFQLDSLSPAIGIADSLVASNYPLDKNGNARMPKPDAGCYQYFKKD